MSESRRLIVMRHSERVDDLFPKWYDLYADDKPYEPFDLNMPTRLRPSDRPIKQFKDDTPLTTTGRVLAQMVGRGIGLNRLTPAFVYCSPALRCVHTAAVVAKSAGCENILLRVEPGLFENTDLYPDGRPTLLCPEALKKAGFPVDCDYKPFVPLEQVWSKPESIVDYNARVHKTLGKVLETITKAASTTSALVVAHASTMDLAMGLLTRPTPRLATANDLYRIGDRVPYCACAVFEKPPRVDHWTWSEHAVPPVTYANFSSRMNRDFVTRR